MNHPSTSYHMHIPNTRTSCVVKYCVIVDQSDYRTIGPRPMIQIDCIYIDHRFMSSTVTFFSITQETVLASISQCSLYYRGRRSVLRA